MRIGYARVSTLDQNVDLQLKALDGAGCEQIFTDLGHSGAQRSRPGLAEAMALLRPGDTLVIWRLDRLGRSLSHLIELVEDFGRRGIALYSVTEAIDTGSAGGLLIFHIMGALAEFERGLISERTRAGMAAARLRGQSIGRPVKLRPGDLDAALDGMTRGGLSLADAARRQGISRATLWRALRRRRELVTIDPLTTVAGEQRVGRDCLGPRGPKNRGQTGGDMP